MWANWLRRRFPVAKRKFMLVGAGIAIINALVLTALVSLIGMNPLVANLTRQTVTAPLHFAVHRQFIWRDRKHEPFLGQLWRHLGLKAGSILTKQLCFLVLVGWFNTPYLIAYCLCAGMVGLGTFNLTRKFVFRSQDADKAT